jgi:choline dehydrogenase
MVLKPESSGTITVTSSSVYERPVIDPKYGNSPRPCLVYADVRPRSFFASDNDMNVLIRGVRFAMRIGRAECGKGIFEPKADSTDTKDFFYMGDADPDRVRTISSPLLFSPSFLFSFCKC